jgi:hypothetical protein
MSKKAHTSASKKTSIGSQQSIFSAVSKKHSSVPKKADIYKQDKKSYVLNLKYSADG